MNWKIKIAKIILDEVITTVSEQEFNRLAGGLNTDQITKKVLDALESLGKLQKGEMSDYHDEWVALFYNWYQPSQINLAYSMIKSMINSTGILNEKLHIVDFGCGSLAMQFGVALAIADTKNKKSITEIRIDSIDTSQAMIDIGEKMWELFKLRTCRYPDIYNHLGRVCEIINPNYYKGIGQVELAQSSDRWISAIHVVYDENKDDIKQSLESLVDRLHPDTCFVSTHSSKDSLLSDVWPFAPTSRKNIYLQPQFNGELTKITQWRKKRNNTLSQSHDYLTSPVKWKWRPATIWCFYSKRYRTHLRGW